MKENIQLKAIFKGKVQGVFFRYHVKKTADKFEIKGYVKNLEDGSVELLAVSDQETLNKFLQNIQKNPGYSKIDSIDKSYSKNFIKYKDFKIIY